MARRSPLSGPVTPTALAVDIGGTKLAAAVIDANGRILSRTQAATPRSERPDEVAGAVVAVAREALRGTDTTPDQVGIGSAGPVDPDAGTASPVNIPAWRGFPIVEAVSTVLPGRPVRLAGDGQCMALGEYWHSVTRPRTLLGMVVSTGVGGGLVLDGVVQTGPTGNAGHIGHMVIDPDGPPCTCGGRGCVETFASGRAMVRWALDQGWRPGPAEGPDEADLALAGRASDRAAGPDGAELALAGRAADRAAGLDGAELAYAGRPGDRAAGPDGVELALAGRPGDRAAGPDGAELARCARAGDAIARAAFARASRAVAVGVLCAAALIDLDEVVIGGGVLLGAGDLLLEPIRTHVHQVAGLEFVRRVRIGRSQLGGDAGLFGAAALALSRPGTPLRAIRESAR
jgi:glucokinase